MATNDFTKRYLERRRELGLSSGQTTTQQTPGRTQITTPASANSNAAKPAYQGTARQESGNSYTSGYLAKRRELMGGGVTGGQTHPSATLPSIPSLSSSLRRFTPTQLLQDVLKQTETTRPAGGQTTTPAETMSSADMSARLDELRELRDTAEADRNEARTVLTGVNRYGTQAQREEWNSKLERAEADYSRYDQEYNELLDRYYQTENEEKRASLQQDEAMSGQYQSAQDIQADMDKVSAVMAYTVTHDGDAAQVEEYKQYLFDKYGLDQKAVDQYAISGAGGAYVPRTDGGYNNIYELYLELQEKKENAVSTLSEGGYDYERMTGYEDMLEDAAQYREDMGEWQEYAREHPILSSVDTLLTAPFQGFDFLRVMGQNIGHSDRDDPENYVPMNSYDMELTNYINAVRQTVSEEIEGATNWEIFDQNVVAFLYQTGMSIGDSSLNLLAFGPTGALVVGSSTAAANQAKDIIDRGGSKEQAFMGGMAAGAFEAVFEKVSIDNLLATKSVTGWKSWLKETAKQAGIEASEETFTEIANILADAAIMGDNSNYDVAVAEYVAQGMNQEDAERQAFFDLIGQVVQAGVGGAISGGVMGGVVNGVNGMANAAYNRYNQQMVQENDVKNTPVLETNPQEGPVQSQNEGEIDSSIPEATRQAVEMLVRGEEISGNQAARIAESEEAVALLSQLTGEEVNTDAPISRVKSDIRALASREGRTSGEAGVNSRATQSGAQTQKQQNAERPTAQRAYDILRVQQAATTLGESGSRALTAAYDGSVDAGSFYAGFAAYYEAGVSGMDMGRVRSEYAQDLTEAQRYAAYTAGQNDAAASLQREREGVQFATVYGDEAGFIPSEHSRNLSQDTVRFYNALGRATGTKITVTAATGEGGANGWYSNGTVYIAADAESAGSVVAKHEITHRLQEIAPEAYRTYRDYAVNAMAERDGSTATLVERYKARYAQSGVNLTTEQAMDEIAADFTEALTVDPSRFDTLAQEHRSVARRVLDALRDFISKVKALFKGRSDQDRAAMSEYGVSMETLERAARLWEETLRAGQAQVSTMTEAQQRVEFSDVNTRYSLREKEPPKKTGVAYKVFFAKNGELYPPMVANPGGEGTPVGVWLDADVGQAAPPSKTGRAQVQAGGRGTNAAKGSLAFRPGWHLGDIPLAKQFARKNPATGVKDLFPADFVWAECEYAMDVDYQEEAMSYGYTENGKFRHSYAGLPKLPTDGYYRYRTNPNPDTVPWIITGAMRVRRILTDAETDAICREAGVEPMQRQGGPLDEAGLERLGLEAGDVTGNTRFSMKSAVEDNGTLLALHNLTEDKLRSALRLGGFPMPSIAVTRADIPHTNFGDITLVMSRQTVDPRANRRNTVYSADAWTPTFPAIEYEADPQAERRISRRIGELSAQVDPFFQDDLRRVQYGLDDYLNRHGGEEGLARWAMDNYGLKAAYLEEQGQHITAVTTQREADRGYNMDRAEQYQAVADVLGTTGPEAIGSMNLKELRDQHGEALERAYPGMTKSALRMSGVLRQVQAYLEGRDSEPTYEAVTDSAATRRAVDNALDQAGYERWVRELYSGIEAASGVYNNKERFTPSGNRRSFQQTHYPVTLDNITKAMAGQNNGDSRNVSGFYGIKSLRAGMAERFKSIADMHRLEGRLQNLTQEEADAISNALDSRLSSIMEELAEKSPSGGRRYDYIRAYNSSLETAEIAGDLQSLYDYIASGRDGSDELTYTEARRRSDAIARKLVDSAAVLEDDAYRDYADLRSYLRSTPLSISAEDSHDIADFGDFRRRNFGRMTIRSGPTNIDQVYQEMSGMWPEFFDETRESTPSDQLVHIAEVLDGIYRVTERNPFSGYFDAAVTDASNEVMERFFDLPQTRPTFADRQARKLDDAKAAGRRRLAEQRERSDARLNELRQQNRERVQRAIQRERETRARQIDRLKTRYAARDAAGRERRSARELRARISRHVADLSRRLLRPSDKQHIPEQLRTAVAAMLDAINLESVYTVDPETGRRRKGGNGDPTKRTEAFRALRQAYANITKDGADYTLIIDPDLMDNLTELEAMRDTPLAEMGTAQLSTIWATVRAVEASIRTANRMLGESRFRTISQVAEGIRNDNIMRQDRGDYRGILGKVDRLVNLDMLTPQGYFHRMGPTGDALFRMLRSAQDRHIEIMRSAQEATRDIIGSVDTTQLERETHTFDVDGQKLTMSTAQIMALYELMKRQQAQEHIFTGGIRPEAVRTGRGLRENRRADAVHVTVEDLAEITGVLTEEQVKIADALQKYMGGQLAELGNQASMEVYGYRKFTEPNYFPIQVDRNQTQRDIAKEAQAQTIAGRGFTKGTVPRANNAVMVGSIFDIFASHVNDMATYSAWLPTMENVRRIRDFTFRDSEGNRTGTVKSVIERVFGRNGNAYLNKLVDDLNQGVRTAGSGNFMDSIVGNYKAAAVAANLRVIAQQPTAILRALNTMDAKYLLAGTVRRGDWEKVMKYAPIARWKDWGYFDINTGRQMKDVLLGSSTRLEKLRQAGMAGAGKADSIAWARLWNAVEAETKDRRPGLKPGTDAFYRAVGDRFSEIVDQTQVVDGILQRSQIMRSSDALTKISTSFMGEPTKSYNMFVNAVYDLRHATSQQGRSRAKRALARTTTALAVSFTVNAIMQSLVDALRDDDKETDYWEKVFQAFTGFTGDEETVLDYWNSFWSGNLEASYNPLAYMPYFKDLVSIAQGYDVTRMDMEAIEKVWSAFTNMRSALSGEGRYSIAGASANMLAEVARLFGLPVANIKRDVQAVATTAAIETDNYLMQYRMDKALLNIGYQGNRSGFMDILYAASVNDPEAYEIIYEDMVASGITEDQIRTAMESRMKEDQGVESVDELSRRYLTPNQERTYDRLYGQVSSSPVWRAASPEQREAVEEDIYDLTTGTDAGVKLQEKIDGGAAYGITEADYLLYLAAREIADGENEDPEKRNGSIDQAEAQAAIDMLTGLSDEGRAYLWQSTNKGWSEEKNPYR